MWKFEEALKGHTLLKVGSSGPESVKFSRSCNFKNNCFCLHCYFDALFSCLSHFYKLYTMNCEQNRELPKLFRNSGMILLAFYIGIYKPQKLHILEAFSMFYAMCNINK